MIAGLEKPDSGTVMADGLRVTGPGRDRLVMFQEAALFPWLDVLGNVLFGLKMKPHLTSKDRKEVARYYLELVGLSRFERSNIHELSGGMKQRVALARALAPNPRMLLMDEPFAALDALTREQLYGDLQQIWESRRKTIIFVTHNVREAACLGDRVLLFSPHPGRIREEFLINLPRPRDINSPEPRRIRQPDHALAQRHSRTAMERSQNETLFLIALVFCRACSRSGSWSVQAAHLVAGASAGAAQGRGISPERGR